MRSALLAVSWLLIIGVGGAAAGGVPLKEGVAQSIKGKAVECVQDGRHGFYLRPIGTDGKGKKAIEQTATSITVSGTFRHLIAFGDDKVHYKVVVEKGKPPRGEITAIYYGGASKSPWIKVGSKVAGAVVPGIDANDILDAVEKTQRWRIGSWEGSAQLIVDEMARQLAEMLDAGGSLPQ